MFVAQTCNALETAIVYGDERNNSPLFTFGNNDEIRDENHRQQLLAEVDELLANEWLEPSIMGEEIAELNGLRSYIVSFAIS